MGNPLLDFSAVVKPEILTKYNLKSNDAILYDKEDIFEELKADYEVEYIAGKILLTCLTIFTYQIFWQQSKYLNWLQFMFKMFIKVWYIWKKMAMQVATFFILNVCQQFGFFVRCFINQLLLWWDF